MAETLITGFLVLAASLVVIAAFDVPFVLWRNARDLRMTREEMRQETRESEGDPQIRMRVRGLQREMARKRMMAEVPKADVVVTNPTHFAVALAYRDGMRAPRVVAKGSELIALRIRELAAANHVPLLEAPMLARALYRHAPLGAAIPPGLYDAVAQVLAWVFQLRRSEQSGQSRRPRPNVSMCRRNSPCSRSRHERNAGRTGTGTGTGTGRPLRRGVCRPAAHRPDPGDDDPAAAAARSRPVIHVQHRTRHGGAAGGGVHGQAARLRGFSDHPAADHPAAPVAQRRLDAGGAAQRPYRPGRRGQGDRGVRPLPGRRQLRRRPRRVHHPGDHQLRRHHQGRGPDRRSERALHARRDARQADGDRRRPQRRPDR